MALSSAAVLSLLVALSRLYISGSLAQRRYCRPAPWNCIIRPLIFSIARLKPFAALLSHIDSLLTASFSLIWDIMSGAWGLYLGFALGVLFEERYVNFSVKGTASEGTSVFSWALCLGVLKFTLDLLGG